jgi:hypothetical protein
VSSGLSQLNLVVEQHNAGFNFSWMLTKGWYCTACFQAEMCGSQGRGYSHSKGLQQGWATVAAAPHIAAETAAQHQKQTHGLLGIVSGVSGKQG